MRKDILSGPARRIQPDPVGQEAETGLRQVRALFPDQHGVELRLEGVQMQHVGRRIARLRVGQFVGAPIGRLLLLRHVDAEQFAHQVLKPVLVGVGAGDPRGDLGAIDRRRHHAERPLQDAEVEPGEMEDLENGWSIVVVADGAGSARLSRKGSALACQGIIDYFMTPASVESMVEFDELVKQHKSNTGEDTQKKLLQMRSIIRKAAPEAEEKISYGMPAFNLHDTYLVYFGGYKNHIGLYPAPIGVNSFKKDLDNYNTGKGSVQFPLSEPLPSSLITRIVEF